VLARLDAFERMEESDAAAKVLLSPRAGYTDGREHV